MVDTLQYAWTETAERNRSTFTDWSRKELHSSVSKIVLQLVKSYGIGIKSDNNAKHAPSELYFEACVRVGGNQRGPNWEKWEAVIAKHMSNGFTAHVAVLMGNWRQ